jgi:deazaflavin-dependent oxidoreductase (nitroreductase family)
MAANAWNQKTADEFHAKNGRGIGPFGDHLLLMTARGVKSGEPIITPLVYHREGDQYVVAGSKGGAPDNPKWVANLRAHPEVEVEIAKDGGTETFKARARVIDSGAERDRLYADHAKVWPPFLDYEKKTERTIPVVMLERLPS